jgi:hypothetical protein
MSFRKTLRKIGRASAALATGGLSEVARRGVGKGGTGGNSGITPIDYEAARARIKTDIHPYQERGLAFSRGLSDRLGASEEEYTANARGLRGRYEGNAGGYIQARVNPILEAGTRARGELSQQHGLRRIGGSSFANQDIANLEFDTARREGDARAIGERENLGALSQIDKDRADNTFKTILQQSTLNNENYEVAKSRLIEELGLLGLSQQQLAAYLKAFDDEQNRKTAERGQNLNFLSNFIPKISV